MASLSERLRRERELRGISLRQISEETRIGVRFLEALEADRLDIIPGEFYRRSYLRAYARYLGLDEDRALNAYDFSRKDKSPRPPAERGPATADPPSRLPKWLKWVLGGVAVGAPTVLLLAPPPAGSSHPEAAPVASARLSAYEATAIGSAAVEPSSSPFSVEPSSIDSALRLELSVQESCWLEVEADGKVVLSGLKGEGFREEVRATRELRLWLGNAGGVKLLVNDRPVRSLGRPGQVRRDLTITPENYRDFVSTEDPS